MRRLRVIGIGAGHPDQVTVEAVAAMSSVDFFLVVHKSDNDPLAEARTALLARHLDVVPPVVTVRDPERDRRPEVTARHDDYRGVVADWHDARAAVFEEALNKNAGDAGILVWGDPAFYDSTIRIVEKVLARGVVEFDWDVIPGISSLQVLAARHRIVLHDVGQPIVVTTGRRLREAIAAGADNVLAMLNARLDLDGLDDWQIWWGANLGTSAERLVAGRVGDVRERLDREREAARTGAGWLMDAFLLRLTSPSQPPSR